MKNIHYGKLVDGNLVYADSPLIVNGVAVWTNDETLYNEQGYLLVVNTEQPVKEGFCYIGSYVEQDGKLVRVWDEHEVPQIEPEVPVETRVAELEAENTLLNQQVEAMSGQLDFYEECIVEMANVVYS